MNFLLLGSLLLYLVPLSRTYREFKCIFLDRKYTLRDGFHSQTKNIVTSDLKSTIDSVSRSPRTFFIETHGCQMNLADSDIVRSVLLSVGYTMIDVAEEADLILVNTCAIRENAEAKVWQRIKYFQSLRRKTKSEGSYSQKLPLIGVLGCMAENLKTKLIEDSGVDFIAGPDAYRSLPELIAISTTDQRSANVQLSLDETYADIQPVRLAEGNTHAFVTITRGCDNHCAFCIVPYTRWWTTRIMYYVPH